jgi:CubicO group peptidase (beta-lactamase class C family)
MLDQSVALRRARANFQPPHRTGAGAAFPDTSKILPEHELVRGKPTTAAARMPSPGLALGFLITLDQVPGKRSPGTLSWGGINNTYFWIDQSRGIAGVILMQYLPFADPAALAVHDAFERAAYQLADGM